MAPLVILPPALVEARPLDGYRVHLRFADGLAADVDLTYLVGRGPVFEPLRDPEFFRRLQIDDWGVTIEWPNEADIAPETLYDHVQRAVYEQQRAQG
ncbi:MAG TPA: DUF2442 domain-containing protein [Solirubrobacterales bacterium]|nr:DUF2442 domain-containing protein [Solirubrobacterales bacterium]